MKSNHTPVLGEQQTCPYSGLPITTKPEWQQIQTGSDYSMSFGIIGDNILHTVPQGNVRTVDIEQTIEARKAVILDHFGETSPVFIEIRDFSNVHGVPSHHARSLFRKSLKAQINQKGLFIINTGWIIRSVFLAGMRLHQFHFKMKLSQSYEQAIGDAQDIAQHLSAEPLQEWHTQTKSINITHKLINDSTIYTDGVVQIVQEDVPQLLGEYEKVLQAKELSRGPIYRIADYTKIN
jgi:hypothetical protein